MVRLEISLAALAREFIPNYLRKITSSSGYYNSAHRANAVAPVPNHGPSIVARL